MRKKKNEAGFFVRMYDITTKKVSQFQMFLDENEATANFNSRACEESKQYNQPFCSYWTTQGITWCDFGSHVLFLQKGPMSLTMTAD
jgi:hypothetical protein